MKCRIIFATLAIILLFQGVVSAVTIRDAIFKTKNAGRVVFSHTEHLQKSGITNNCRACHDAIFDLRKKTRHSMADMAHGKSCGACHDGKTAFPLENCALCHQTKEIVFKVKATGPTRFSHKSHVAVMPDCSRCHPSLFSTGKNKRATMAAMQRGKSCGACHNGKQAFTIKECSKCHPVQELLFEEKSTGNVIFSHKFHLEVHTCVDCHPSLYQALRSKIKISMQAMEKGKSCGACHDGKAAFSVKEKCEACHRI